MRKGIRMIALAALVLGSARLAASEEAYVIWDRVRFGMPLEELRELYPDVRHAESMDAATAKTAMPWQNYFLSKRKFGPLEGCAVHLMLMRGYVVRANFYCSKHGPEEVGKVLEEKYGFPTGSDEVETVWMDGPARISMNQSSGYFGIDHMQKADEITKSVLAPAYDALKAKKGAEKAGGEGASGAEGAKQDRGQTPSGGAGAEGDRSEE